MEVLPLYAFPRSIYGSDYPFRVCDIVPLSSSRGPVRSSLLKNVPKSSSVSEHLRRVHVERARFDVARLRRRLRSECGVDLAEVTLQQAPDPHGRAGGNNDMYRLSTVMLDVLVDELAFGVEHPGVEALVAAADELAACVERARCDKPDGPLRDALGWHVYVEPVDSYKARKARGGQAHPVYGVFTLVSEYTPGDVELDRQLSKCVDEAVDVVLVHKLVSGGDVDTLRTVATRVQGRLGARSRSGGTALHAAARGGSVEMICYLLTQDVDIDAVDADGRTPLMAVCCAESASTEVVEVVGLLLKHGASAACKDPNGVSGIMLAAANSATSVEVMRMLLAARTDFVAADVDAGDKRGRTALMHACAGGASVGAMAALLEHGTSVMAEDWEGHTPLMYACANSASVEVVAELLEHGASVVAEDWEGRTPLMYACANSASAEVVELLLTLGASAATKDRDGMTALLFACSNSASADVLRLLLGSKEADVDAEDPLGRTAFMQACGCGASAELVGILLERGGSVVAKDTEGRTPLMHACANNASAEVVEVLLARGASAATKDRNGMTALLFACSNSASTDVLRLLLGSKKVDVNSKDPLGRTALAIACVNNASAEVVGLFLERDASVNSEDRYARAPLMHACASGASVEVVGMLLERGASVVAKDTEGRTPLMHACANNARAEVVEVLLARGASAATKDRNGMTALLFACSTRASADVLRLLLGNAKVGVNSQAVDGWTPLMLACCNGARAEVLELLLGRGANVATKDRYGITALMFACFGDPSVEVMRALLSASDGAVVNAEDKGGQTALMHACANGASAEVVEMLLECGASVAATAKNGGTALMFACAANADATVVDVLLRHGADIEAADVNNNTALVLTCAHGASPQVVRLLLKSASCVSVADAESHTAHILACFDLVLHGHRSYAVATALLAAGLKVTAAHKSAASEGGELSESDLVPLQQVRDQVQQLVVERGSVAAECVVVLARALRRIKRAVEQGAVVAHRQLAFIQSAVDAMAKHKRTTGEQAPGLGGHSTTTPFHKDSRGGTRSGDRYTPTRPTRTPLKPKRVRIAVSQRDPRPGARLPLDGFSRRPLAEPNYGTLGNYQLTRA